MQETEVQGKRRKKYTVTTNSNHKQRVFENVLNRQFDVAQPNQVYVGNRTYLWTQERWLFIQTMARNMPVKPTGYY
jgi:putative transposase